MSVDWNAFAAHRAELENKILRMERDALATALSGAVMMFETLKPLIVDVAGAEGPDLKTTIERAILSAKQLISDATKERK